VCVGEQLVVFQDVGELFSDYRREEFTSRVEESDGSKCFGDRVVRLARLPKYDSGKTTPWLIVHLMGENCVKEGSEIGYKGACAFLEYYVADAVWSPCLVAAKVSDGVRYLVWGNGRGLRYRVRVFKVWGYSIIIGGRREKGLSDNVTLVDVHSCFEVGAIRRGYYEGGDTGLATITWGRGDVSAGRPEVIALDILEPFGPVLLLGCFYFVGIEVFGSFEFRVAGVKGQTPH
jgi:hypothetical protein